MKIVKNHIHILLYAFIFVSFLYPLPADAQVISKAPEDLFIVGSESINFHSEITDSDYKLYINLPESYDTNAKKTYPVYYALDASRTFALTTRIYKGLWNDGLAPEIIIVGIDYNGSKTNPNLHRSRDLTPTHIERIPTSGGASKFLKVLSDEIIPFIDNHYRSDKSNRTLAGTSFAGLFTHYTLFTQPTLFNNYIINNLTFWWDNGYAYQLEEKFYQKNTTLNARVLFLSGEFDALKETTQMVEQIKGRNSYNLDLDFRMVENMMHLGGEAEAINQGMRFAYKRSTIKIPEEELKQYCGTYQDGDYVREVVIRDGELSLKALQESSGVKIHAINKNEFALLGRYFNFHFNKNEKGEVISFSSQRDTDPSRTTTAVKIN
ncbi:MAG: alpha/beta hydrolase-fold protein [Bacteroidota bacterium]